MVQSNPDYPPSKISSNTLVIVTSHTYSYDVQRYPEKKRIHQTHLMIMSFMMVMMIQDDNH